MNINSAYRFENMFKHDIIEEHAKDLAVYLKSQGFGCRTAEDMSWQRLNRSTMIWLLYIMEDYGELDPVDMQNRKNNIKKRLDIITDCAKLPE
jgi:hypothetical protein